MRKHLTWITLIMLAFYLGPDILAVLSDLVSGKSLATAADKYFSIFSFTGIIVFLYGTISFFLLFYKYYGKVSTLIFILMCIGLTFSFIAFRYLFEEVLMPAVTGWSNYNDATPLSFYFFDNLLYVFFYGSIGVVYYFVQRTNTNEREKQLLLLEKQQAELSFLRSQINPHFLFNSLNNIYALVYHKNEQSLNAIQKLSELLRYILYAKEDRVPVQKELDYIKNYIDLELMRHEHPAIINFNANIEDKHLTIPPLLLLPLVENAFKHGNLQQTAEPVSISCETKNGTLNFSVRNTKSNKETDAEGGVGLHNIRRRLELLYPNQHTLQVDDNRNHFTVNLQLSHD